MTGRSEENFRIEKKIREMLEGQPEIIKRFYNYLTFCSHEPKTKRAYVRYIIRYSDYLISAGHSIADINYLREQKKTDASPYMEVLRYRKLNDGTVTENGASIIRAHLAALKKFYDYLVDENAIEVNPFNKLTMPKLNKEINVVYMDKTEIKQVKRNIIASKDNNWERDLAIISLGVMTGLRVSAVIDINIEDIDWKNRCIDVVEKGNVQKSVYFGSELENILRQWIHVRCANNGCNALFVSNRGGRISYGAVRAIMEKRTSILEKHITYHKNRDSFGTNLYEETGDIYLVGECLGHKNIQNTRRYVNVSQKRKMQAAMIMDKL